MSAYLVFTHDATSLTSASLRSCTDSDRRVVGHPKTTDATARIGNRKSACRQRLVGHYWRVVGTNPTDEPITEDY